jgi:hypothetical protein
MKFLPVYLIWIVSAGVLACDRYSEKPYRRSGLAPAPSDPISAQDARIGVHSFACRLPGA